MTQLYSLSKSLLMGEFKLFTVGRSTTSDLAIFLPSSWVPDCWTSLDLWFVTHPVLPVHLSPAPGSLGASWLLSWELVLHSPSTRQPKPSPQHMLGHKDALRTSILEQSGSGCLLRRGVHFVKNTLSCAPNNLCNMLDFNKKFKKIRPGARICC